LWRIYVSNSQLLFLVLVSGCAARLNFIDRTNGLVHMGSTGGTLGSSGEATATIDGECYSGSWIYSASGGSYSLTNFNSISSASGTATSGLATATVQGFGTSTGSSSAFVMSAHGNGMLHLRSQPVVLCDAFSLSTTSRAQAWANA
jgi:hypothetical protein